MKKAINRDKSIIGVMLLFAGVLVLLGSPSQALAAGEQFATVSFSSAGIQWNPVMRHNGATLSVSGNDIHLRKIFAAGDGPGFKPQDSEGNRLPDGVYKYELRFVPDMPSGTNLMDFDDGTNGRDLDDSQRSRLRSRRARGEAVTPRLRLEPMVTSGSFTIMNGGIIDPARLETAHTSETGESTK